jgi:hypothetical protein
MAVGLLFHIPSQLLGSVLYSDCTDLHERSKASVIVGVGGVPENITRNVNFNVKNLPEV